MLYKTLVLGREPKDISTAKFAEQWQITEMDYL